MAKAAGQILVAGEPPVTVDGMTISPESFFVTGRAASWPWAVRGQCVGTCQGLGSMGVSTGGSVDRAILQTPVRTKVCAQGTLDSALGKVTFSSQTMTVGTVGLGDAATTLGFPAAYGNLTATDTTFQKGGSPYNAFALLVTGIKARPVEIFQIPTVLTTTTYVSKASYLPENGMLHAIMEMLGDNLTMSATFPDFPITTQFDILATYGDPKGWRDARTTMRSAEAVIMDGFVPLACGYVIGNKNENAATFTITGFDHTKVIENDPSDGFLELEAGGTSGVQAVLSPTLCCIFEISFVGVAICPCVAEVCVAG